MTEVQEGKTCPGCATVMSPDFQFCGQCGAHMAQGNTDAKHWLMRLLNAEGEVESTAAIMPGTLIIGSNTDADILIEGDRAVSPRHVLLRLQDSELSLEDQGSRNGLYRPLNGSQPIGHNDLIRAGGQLFRFQLIERLGVEPVVALPHPAFGPAKPAWGRLLRYNRHGQVSATRLLESDAFAVGRRAGDWALKRARTMSGEHFELRRDEEGAVSIDDLNSRNGTFVEIRGAASVSNGDSFLIGDRIVRADQVPLSSFHDAIGTADDLEIHEAQMIDEADVNPEETLMAIPEDIEAAMEDSIPPIFAEGGEVEAAEVPGDEVVEAEQVEAKAVEEPAESNPADEVGDEAQEEADLSGEPEALASEEQEAAGASDEPSEVADQEIAEQPSDVESESDAETDEESVQQPDQAEAEAEADLETVAVQQAQDDGEEHPTEMDDGGPGDWAKAALLDFQDDSDDKA